MQVQNRNVRMVRCMAISQLMWNVGGFEYCNNCLTNNCERKCVQRRKNECTVNHSSCGLVWQCGNGAKNVCVSIKRDTLFTTKKYRIHN